MNILWITLESILPANSGGRLGVFKRLEQLSKTEQIYLFYTYDHPNELSYAEELKKYCTEVYPYRRNRMGLNLLWYLFKYPYTVASRNISKMKADIEKCIKQNKIDIINVDFPHMCVNLLDMDIKVPIVLNEHNIEWKVYKTISKSQTNILKSIAYWIDSYRLKTYEQYIFKNIDIKLVTFVSDKDMHCLQKEMPGISDCCQLIPVGADIKTIRENSTQDHQTHNIIFVGKMSYGPNIEAVIWFVDNVFEKIRELYADARFYIVGKDPVDEVKALVSDHIIVTGQVDSVDEYYSLADLVVLPLLHGGGVKVKLLEAISFNKNIVSTSIGVEGTRYADGKTILVKDTPKDFAKACIDVFQNYKEIQERRKNIYRIFKDHYTWEKIGALYKYYLCKIGR